MVGRHRNPEHDSAELGGAGLDDHLFIPANTPSKYDGLRASVSTDTNTKFGENRGGMKGIAIVNYAFYKQANWTLPRVQDRIR